MGQAWVRRAGGGAGGRWGGRRGDGAAGVPLPIAGGGPPGWGPCNETDASVSDTETWMPCSHGDSLHMRRSARSQGEPCLAPHAPPTMTPIDTTCTAP